jgi:cell division protein FtsB
MRSYYSDGKKKTKKKKQNKISTNKTKNKRSSSRTNKTKERTTEIKNNENIKNHLNDNIIDFEDKLKEKEKRDKVKKYVENDIDESEQYIKDKKIKRKKNKKKNSNKNTKNISLENIIFVLISLMLTIYIISSFVEQDKKIKEIKENKARIEKQIQREKIINQNLKNQIENVDTNKFVERTAREKLKMVYDGEIMYIDTNKME